jgi:mannose-6-phosphate isomerase-like protein (cupin superfamily)
MRTSVAVQEGTSRTRIDPDTDDRFSSLRRALGVSTFGINQIVLQPGQRLRIHRHHRQEEVYLVLEGRLTLAVEARETALEPGELMRVAPDVRRQLINRGPARVVLIALGADGEHDGRDGQAFTSWEETTGAPPQEVALPDDLSAEERGS